MLRTVLGGAVVGLLVGAIALAGPTIGIATTWPVVLAVALGLAAGPAVLSRTAAAAIGAVVGFVAAGLEIGVFPSAASASAVVLVVVVVALAAVAALSGGWLPLWASLVGYAAFAGLYAPIGDASPTTFLSDAPVVLVTVLLALGLGAVAAIGAAAVTAPRQRPVDGHLGAGEVA